MVPVARRFTGAPAAPLKRRPTGTLGQILFGLIASAFVLTGGCRREPSPQPSGSSKTVDIKAAYETARLPDDPDDPAVWRHPSDPSRSLIIGTIKVAAPTGGIVVFGLDGVVRQTISGID